MQQKQCLEVSGIDIYDGVFVGCRSAPPRASGSAEKLPFTVSDDAATNALVALCLFRESLQKTLQHPHLANYMLPYLGWVHSDLLQLQRQVCFICFCR